MPITPTQFSRISVFVGLFLVPVDPARSDTSAGTLGEMKLGAATLSETLFSARSVSPEGGAGD